MPDDVRPADPVKAPQDWDKAVSVAYLRLIGYSQEASAENAGVGRRTVQEWERCSWWADALDEASRRWLSGIEAKARKALERGLDMQDDGNLALKILERRFPELAPATQKSDLTSGGQPLPASITVELVRPAPNE